MREIKPLTTLRAIAALLVFLYHYAILRAPDGGAGVFLGSVWSHGYLGVPVFFVLSGFLLTRLYFDQLREGSVGLGPFLIRRVARIWPLFVVLAVAQHGVAWWMGRTAPSLDWLITMTMSQGWFAGALHDGLPQAWSLTIEETFYLGLPVCCLVLDRLVFGRGPRSRQLGLAQWSRLAMALGILVLVTAVVGVLVARLNAFAGTHWRGFLGDPAHMLRMTLAGRMPEFAIGMVVAFLHRDGRLLAGPLRNSSGVLALLLAAAIGTLMVLKNSAPPGGQYAVHIGVAAATGGLILMLCGDRPEIRWLGWTPLLYLGRVSYAFYLVQLTVFAERLENAAARCGSWHLAVLLVLLLVLSAGLYELVERPARRLIVARWAPSERQPGG